MILKISENTKFTIKLRTGKVVVGGNNKVEHNDKCEFSGSEFGSNEINGSEIKNNKVVKEKNHQKISKFKLSIRSSDFFISRARLTIIKLR